MLPGKRVPYIFAKSLYTLLFVSAMAIYLYVKAGATRQDLQVASGRIVQIGDAQLKGKDVPDTKLIQIENYNKLFPVFVGKASGDFGPVLNKIAELQPGNLVNIYFDEGTGNRSVRFIDKDNEAYFVAGRLYTGGAAYCIWGIAAATIILLIVLKKKGKIA